MGSKLPALGLRIRRIRLEKGLNQKEFAKLGGVSITSQQQYEAAKTPPTVEYLYRLSEHGVDIVELLTGQGADGSLGFAETQLLDVFSSLSGREREAIMAMLMVLAGRTVDLDATRQAEHATLHQPGRDYRGIDDDG